jgi:hypothetical protein
MVLLICSFSLTGCYALCFFFSEWFGVYFLYFKFELNPGKYILNGVVVVITRNKKE